MEKLVAQVLCYKLHGLHVKLQLYIHMSLCYILYMQTM